MGGNLRNRDMCKMNDVIRLLNQHRSDRSFSDRPVDESLIAEIVEAGHRAPSSHNGQNISVVVVRDAKARARIAELANGQPWIAKAPVFLCVVADYHKTEAALAPYGKTQVAPTTLEGNIVVATDAGIVLATMMTAARSLGLGVVPIGGMRVGEAGMIELLHLPHLTYAVVGMCLGYVEKPAAMKPRLAISTFRHDEVYADKELSKAIADYDRTLTDHWKAVGRSDGEAWSVTMSSYLDHATRPKLRAILEGQGFRPD